MSATILVMPGDGVGPEICREAVRVLEALADRHGLDIELSEAPVGGAAIDAEGDPLPEASLAAARAAYDRVWNALMLWSFLAGFGCAAFVRPDLSWLPPLGGLAVMALTASAPVPTAWTYLRVNAAAPRRPPA